MALMLTQSENVVDDSYKGAVITVEYGRSLGNMCVQLRLHMQLLISRHMLKANCALVYFLPIRARPSDQHNQF